MSANRVNKKFLSDVDSRDLIKEVRSRPGLYDSSVLEPPRKDQRQMLWQEVGERLTDTDIWEGYTSAEREARLDEIREKWRHLRNNFLREIKLLRSGEKKRKYIFFDEMEFMKPFVGIKIRGPNKIKSEMLDDPIQDSADEERVRKPRKVSHYSKYEDSCREMSDEHDFIEEHKDAMTNSNDEDTGEPAPPVRVNPPRAVNAKAKQVSHMNTSAPKQKLTKEQEMIIKRFDVIKKQPRRIITLPAAASTKASSPATGVKHVVNATGNPNRLSLRFFDMRDSDISFCMSMVSTFRKMGESKKLRAKIDMLKVLHKYADDLDEPKPRARAFQQQKSEARAHNNSHEVESCLEEDLCQSMDDHTNENGIIKNEEKLHGRSNNVWWT